MYAKRNKSVTLLNLVIFLGIKLLIICNHTHLQRPRGGQNKGRGESFQERVREPLECDSYRTSSTTHSNALISLIFVLSQRPASIALLSWSSYTNESTFKQQLTTIRLICLARAGELWLQKRFHWKPKKCHNFRVLSRIYRLGEKSWVAEGHELPRGVQGHTTLEIFWNEYALICKSFAFWDTILRNGTVCALTSSRLDDFSDVVTYIL